MFFKKVVLLLSLFFLLLHFIILPIVRRSLEEKGSHDLNLVIISIDTLRPDHMGIYGYSKNTTPNISNFAKDATVFTNVTTVVPMTYPSFTALMTGKDPLNTRVFTNKNPTLSNNTSTLATILKKNNFLTAAFTSGDLSPNATGLNQGFDTFQFYGYKHFFFNENHVESYDQSPRPEYEKLVHGASSWLMQNKNKRFFLWLHLMDPHRPYQPPDDLLCKFNPKYCSAIKSKKPEQLELEKANNQFCRKSIPKDLLEMNETLYDGGVAYSDRLTKEIFDALKKQGLEKNTIVMIYGDHGEGLDHNYFFNHRAVLYNSAVKIPLIIKDPLQTSPRQSDQLIQNVDILPSLLDLLGVSYNKKTFDGYNFSNLFHNDIFAKFFTVSRKVSYSMNNTATKFSINDGHYKYIYSLRSPSSCLLDGQTQELYDVQNDPDEKHNIFSKQRDIATILHEQLLSRLSEYNLPRNIGSTNASSPKKVSNPTPSEDNSSEGNNNIERLRGLSY